MATVLEFNAALLPRGPFDLSASYETLNFVESGGSGYVCLQPCSGIPVTNTAYWFKFVHKGDPGTPFTYADLTAEQKAELAHDATIAAQAAQAAAEQAAQKFNTIKASIDAIDPQSTEGSIQTLAAKQGVLEAELDQLGPELSNEVTFSLLDYALLANGKFGTSTSSKHAAIAVEEGDKFLVIGEIATCRYAFATSNAASSGATAPLVSGTSVVEMTNPNTFYNVTIPSGCTYLLITAGGSYGTRLYKKGRLDRMQQSIDDTKSKVVAVNTKLDNNLSMAADLSSLDQPSRSYLDSSGTWLGTAARTGSFLPVTAGDKIAMVGSPNGTCRYSFLTEIPSERLGGGTPPYVTGTTVMAIGKDEYVEFTIPEGCNYLHFNRTYTTTDDYCPAAIYFSGTRIPKLEQRVSTLETSASSVSGLKASFAGDNGTIAYSADKIYGVYPHATYRCVFLTPDVEMYDTSGANNRFVLNAYNEAGTNIGQIYHLGTQYELPNHIDFEVPEGTSYLKIGGRCKRNVVFSCLFYPVNGEPEGDILTLNPESEFLPKFLAARKRYYTSSNTGSQYPLVLLHISDIHGNWANVERFIKFANKYSTYINVRLNTGDTVLNEYSDGIDGYAAIDGAEKILNVIGNHDTNGTSWQEHIGTDAYERFIAPFVDDWSVTQPSDAATAGKCYYYKDWSNKGVRLVVVDIMAYDSTQDAWLSGVLSDAITNDKHVLIATHFAGSRSSADAAEKAFDKVSCNYTSLYSLGSSSTQLTAYNTNAYLMGATVHAFMQAGGHFCGYVQGHYHADFVAKSAEYPDQLIYSIGGTKAGEMRDTAHTVGTREQDEFQIVSVDPINTIVKLFKVGACYDRYGRKKGSICINYTTGEIVGESW